MRWKKMRETTTKKIGADKILEPTINTEPEIISKHEIGERINDYWIDTVIDSMPHTWFQIRGEGNKVIIEPVKIEAID